VVGLVSIERCADIKNDGRELEEVIAADTETDPSNAEREQFS
jgi:hypothetical protein